MCSREEEETGRHILPSLGWVAEFKHSLARVPTGSLKWVPNPPILPNERGGGRDTLVGRASLKYDSIDRSGAVPPKRAIFKPPERVSPSLPGVWVRVGVFGGQVLPLLLIHP
jgi:hypothetical protein